ncbi:hypothetical protein OUZ56_000762 [Daphnia magna]|uniref:Secreted protein n=1 Tax=Daphnia magna TaxID=35525 RepID=A0ABR0A0P9_9CRUS|nr:hypothetical protein OUZ56_000762 [Daphnia magna]
MSYRLLDMLRFLVNAANFSLSPSLLTSTFSTVNLARRKRLQLGRLRQAIRTCTHVARVIYRTRAGDVSLVCGEQDGMTDKMSDN